MSQITLSTGRQITLLEYKTRKIDREHSEALAEGVMINEHGIQEFPAKNLQRANDVLVAWMASLSQADLDALRPEEFNEILVEIEKLDQKKSSVTESTPKSSEQ